MALAAYSQIRLHVHTLLNQRGNAAVLVGNHDAGSRLTHAVHGVGHAEGAGADRVGATRAAAAACTHAARAAAGSVGAALAIAAHAAHAVATIAAIAGSVGTVGCIAIRCAARGAGATAISARACTGIARTAVAAGLAATAIGAVTSAGAAAAGVASAGRAVGGIATIVASGAIASAATAGHAVCTAGAGAFSDTTQTAFAAAAVGIARIPGVVAQVGHRVAADSAAEVAGSGGAGNVERVVKRTRGTVVQCNRALCTGAGRT